MNNELKQFLEETENLETKEDFLTLHLDKFKSYEDFKSVWAWFETYAFNIAITAKSQERNKTLDLVKKELNKPEVASGVMLDQRGRKWVEVKDISTIIDNLKVK